MFGGEFMNKYKVTLSKKGKQINSVDDWYKYAPPMKKDIHCHIINLIMDGKCSLLL